MKIAKVSEGEYFGVKTIDFECGGYAGTFTIDGANLVKLDYLPKHVSILHQASSQEQVFKSRTVGIPVLFFPNRIKDGTFTFEGKKYMFPINSKNNIHIHGLLNGHTKWTLAKQDVADDFINITFEYILDENSDVYSYFGFKVRIMYENVITSGGLFQRISFENMSEHNMPFGFAYHTTFNIPFNDSPENKYLLNINLKKRYETDQCIPTGQLLELDAYEMKAVGEPGCYPFEKPLDNLYLADADTSNLAVITDTSTGVQLVYETDSKFKHWVVYNGGAKSKFLSLEPQTCCTNAVNTNMDTANLMVVKPGEDIVFCTKIYIKD